MNRKESDKTYSTPSGNFLRRPVWHFSTVQSVYCRPSCHRSRRGLGIWGAINLLEGYGNDNPGAKVQGMKQLMAGGGVALIGITWYHFFPACSADRSRKWMRDPSRILHSR